MKFLLLAFFLLFSCGSAHVSAPQDPTVKDLDPTAQYYSKNITDQVFPERCDKLTFLALVSASGVKQDLSPYEKESGRFERDVNPCYPNDSVSQISRDAYLSILHHIWTYKDHAMLDRIISYGKAHDWIMGEGPTGYTDISLLAPTINKMDQIFHDQNIPGDKDNPSTPALAFQLQSDSTIQHTLAGFQGHLLANYVWLQGRIKGGIDSSELLALKALVLAAPKNPLYNALYHRFTDGKQSLAIGTLSDHKTFPADRVPLDTGVFGWGSAPSMVYFLEVMAVLEGK